MSYLFLLPIPCTCTLCNQEKESTRMWRFTRSNPDRTLLGLSADAKHRNPNKGETDSGEQNLQRRKEKKMILENHKSIYLFLSQGRNREAQLIHEPLQQKAIHLPKQTSKLIFHEKIRHLADGNSLN